MNTEQKENIILLRSSSENISVEDDYHQARDVAIKMGLINTTDQFLIHR